MIELSAKCKRLLIMAIPNDIFESLDSCQTSKDLWTELQKQLEGGAKTLKNNRALCINEYHDFKALEGESIQSTYTRFNSLVNKCRRFGVIRTGEENNVRFLQSLNEEWLHLTMSMQSTLDLEVWSLSDIFGTLVSQESQITKIKKQVGGPLALIGKSTEVEESAKERKEEKKKKKILMVESDDEESSEEEMSMKEMLKSLALITREYSRGFKKPYSDKGRKEWKNAGVGQKSTSQRVDYKAAQKMETRADRGDGCFKCGKPGHFASECWAGGEKPKVNKDASYYKKKAEYYTQKSLMAESNDLDTDESSEIYLILL